MTAEEYDRQQEQHRDASKRWQLRMKAEGRCVQCGRVRVEGSASHCERHRREARERRAAYVKKWGQPNGR